MSLEEHGDDAAERQSEQGAERQERSQGWGVGRL